MKRRTLLQTGGGLMAGAAAPAARAAAQGAAADGGRKVFRWAINFAETGFDPAQVNDLFGAYVMANIFEAPLQYDYLARPTVLKPRTAAAMPEISADFTTITVRIRPGIYFADHPAFQGKRRELVAADYVYQLKRLADPRWKSPYWPSIERGKLLGLAELRKQALDTGKFDYDREIEGIRTLDRYTFRMRLAEPAPRFFEHLADVRPFAGVAREVVEAHLNDIMSHPVGTGPFRLGEWRRSSKVVLERNPAFRDEFYDAQPAPDDTRGQALLARLKGKKLPLVDRVELAVLEESQPRWLSFLNGEQDTVNVPLEFVDQAVPGGKLAPALARRGITLERLLQPDIAVTFFNMDSPVVGGYTPEKVALRRAISLGYDVGEEIRLIRRGAMIVGHSPVPPLTTGYDPAFVSEMGRFDRAAARALLDTFGYVDRDGDGFRENPDGTPLTLEIATESSQIDRSFNELWKRQMDRLGIRIAFKVNQWPENLRAARAGKLQIWLLGNTATSADPDAFLAFGHSGSIGGSNFARFRNAEYDRLYERQQRLPDGPERQAVIREMKRLLVAYMPYKFHGHRYVNDVTHPWLVGFRRHPFARDIFKYIDIDPEARLGA